MLQKIDDKGLMASVTAPYSEVAKVLDETDGYVIAANKNSPKMTVIAGESEPVKVAMRAFYKRILNNSISDLSCIPLPYGLSHEPLRRFLETLETLNKFRLQL